MVPGRGGFGRILMSPGYLLNLLALFSLRPPPLPAQPLLPQQRPLFPVPTQAALRQKEGRAELFIVRLFEAKGFYILMSTK